MILVRRVLQRIRNAAGFSRRWYLRAYYRRRLRAPLDKHLAVYAAYWNRGYACNPAAIYEAMGRIEPEIHGVWIVDRKRAGRMPEGVDHVVPGTRRYYDVLARAGTLINNVNFPDEIVKRDGSTHVMTHHGTPIKHMGLDLRGKHNDGGIRDFDALLRRCGRWDLSLSANAYTTSIWERSLPGPYDSFECGSPRNDRLVNAADSASRIRSALGVAPGKRTLLYAPTHRDTDETFRAQLDLAHLSALLGEAWAILARRHYFYDDEPELAEARASGSIIDVADHPSVEDVCLAADVLCTDYSSIMFDYAVLDRPIIIHASDWEQYRRTRGVYLDLLERAPGPVVHTVEDVATEALGAEADHYASRRATFRREFCSTEDGGASERVVRRLWPSTTTLEQRELRGE